jgi:hypothetical protein
MGPVTSETIRTFLRQVAARLAQEMRLDVLRKFYPPTVKLFDASTV